MKLMLRKINAKWIIKPWDNEVNGWVFTRLKEIVV